MTMDVNFDEVFEHVMMNAVIAACDGNGVLDGLTVSEHSTGVDMSVDVAAGNCLIDDTKYTESSTINLAISAADATYDRKDLVTYDNTTPGPVVTTGTAAATPVPPDIPSGDILLAIVNVAAGVTQITNADIVDGRVMYNDEIYLRRDSAHAMTANLDFGNKYADNLYGIKYNGINHLLFDGSYVDAYRDFRPASDNLYSCGISGVRWSDVWCTTLHQGDTAFAEKSCAKCGKAFAIGDNIILKVIKIDDDTVTIPIHLECANAPNKIITLKKRIMENKYVIDEITGEMKTKQVPKLINKTVIKKRMKKGIELDNKTGEFWQLEDGKRKKKITNAEAMEEYEDITEEVIYEDVEFIL